MALISTQDTINIQEAAEAALTHVEAIRKTLEDWPDSAKAYMLANLIGALEADAGRAGMYHGSWTVGRSVRGDVRAYQEGDRVVIEPVHSTMHVCVSIPPHRARLLGDRLQHLARKAEKGKR
jgi:hypothetical protein